MNTTEISPAKTMASRLVPVVITASIVFILVWLVGGKILDLMDNATCSVLGCNAGFFGYDGVVVHVVGGAMEVIYLFWLIARSPKSSPFHRPFRENFWKNLFIILAILAFLGVVWELIEFSWDHIRIDILHEHLLTLTYNHLAQPSNADTMGDIFFGMVGGTLTFLCFKWSSFFDRT